MWLMTPRGFYSAVQKPEDRPNMITVRARCREDIERLSDLLPEREPYETFNTDYPWRLRCSVADWSLALARMGLEINYSNFKNEVARVQGKGRASVYSRIWSALLALEPRRPWRGSSLDSPLGLFEDEFDREWARPFPKAKAKGKGKGKRGARRS